MLGRPFDGAAMVLRVFQAVAFPRWGAWGRCLGRPSAQELLDDYRVQIARVVNMGIGICLVVRTPTFCSELLQDNPASKDSKARIVTGMLLFHKRA